MVEMTVFQESTTCQSEIKEIYSFISKLHKSIIQNKINKPMCYKSIKGWRIKQQNTWLNQGWNPTKHWMLTLHVFWTSDFLIQVHYCESI